MRKEIEKCPFCQGKSFVTGYGIHAVYPSSLFANPSQAGKLEYTICRDCGSIVRTRATDVDKLI